MIYVVRPYKTNTFAFVTSFAVSWRVPGRILEGCWRVPGRSLESSRGATRGFLEIPNQMKYKGKIKIKKNTIRAKNIMEHSITYPENNSKGAARMLCNPTVIRK